MSDSEARQFVLDALLLVKAVPIAADRIAVLCHYQPALAEGLHLSQVLTVDFDGRWSDIGRFRWHGVDMALRGGAELLVLGRDGQVGSILAGNVSESWLEEGRAMGPMRGIVSSGDATLAFGMNRHVYISDSTTWRRFEHGFDDTAPGAEIDFDALLDDMGGLNAVARTSADSVIAVGMNGEIWRSPIARDAWVKEASSTHVGLSAVCIEEDGAEVAAGQAGIVLRNTGGAHWTEQPYTGPQRLDFTGAVAVPGGVLLADGHALRRLRSGTLEQVTMGTPEVVPAVKLSAGFGLVVGCAPKELFFSRDGLSWTLLL
ncbi:hypothetical protein A176_005492 [Myxococcus hansupus]|uniref:BNR repeat domain protein n=1 Tax=Pseudomyxococcus hansupus TaxID=1297742 RepID=A0A0H4X4R3_9BACT|nr:hypothetical protein [Myxococcus hansupus]AKQ68580.1 hypothetical protein A176_005492 [Myxococcus hansupus]